jgi:D-alanyl-D-alanine dipeptidase
MADKYDSSGFVSVSDVIPDALLDVRYYTTYNFVGERIDGYEQPVVLMTKEAAAALALVNRDMRAQGLRLVIYDAYRPQRAVDHFVRWAEDVSDTRMKAIFYPEVDKADLFERGFIAKRSGHSRGSTVDLTLLDEKSGMLLDMGGPFDFFGELSHPDFAGVTTELHANRMLLRDAMVTHGFRPLSTEWWHFTLVNEPYPDTYFDFPVRAL